MMCRIRTCTSGSVAVEFGLIALPLFITIFGIFDLGRYAITMHSLRTLASATAREVVISCYAPKVSQDKSPSECDGIDPLSTAQKQQIAPALFMGGGSPDVVVNSIGSALTVQVTASSFSMMLPFWGDTLNYPSATATLPF